MDELVYETARRLIAFDTVSSNSDLPAAEFLGNLLEGAGFRTTLHKFQIGSTSHANLVASAGPPREGGLIISGHIDTVPFEGQPGWTRDPLVMEIGDERIYGRGTSDMKGFLAQCVAAAHQIERARLKRPLVFVLTASEEVGCLGAAYVGPALETILDAIPVPRLAWIGEPTSNAVCHLHKSIVAFDIVVHGRGGHSGAPARGVNAIAVMGKVLECIGRLQAERAEATDPRYTEVFPDAPTDVLNVGTISGGIALNMIAEECKLRVSYRSLPDADPLALYHEATRRISAINLHDYALGEHPATLLISPPMVVPPLNSPRKTALEAALFDVTGTSTSGGAVFGTDGGWFERSGINSLICGPGDFVQAHQPNESISRAAFERGSDLILRVIDRMCC